MLPQLCTLLDKASSLRFSSHALKSSDHMFVVMKPRVRERPLTILKHLEARNALVAQFSDSVSGVLLLYCVLHFQRICDDLPAGLNA